MKAIQKTEFFTQLATMTRGGLPLSQAFGVLRQNSNLPVVGAIHQLIEAGSSIETAFDRPEFSTFEKSFIAAGSQTGQLGASFAALAEYWQREVELFRALRQSLLYPLVMLHLSILLSPIARLFSDPPAYVKAVVLNFAALYLIGYGLYRFVRTLWHLTSGQSVLLAIPLVGSLWKSVYRLRWVQIVQMEFKAGLGLPQAVADAWEGTGLMAGTSLARQAQEDLLAGNALSTLWPGWSIMPPAWKGYLVAAETSGQMSGTLDFLLSEATQSYQLRRKNLEEWLPKLLYVAILAVVGWQIVDSYQNMFQQIESQDSLLK